MKKISYNGVSIEVPSERPVFSHSVALMIASLGKIEGNQNIPYFEKLMQYKQSDIPEGELMHDVCALYSIKNLNYQVNNGGFEQYYENGYHKYSAGEDVGDLANLDISQQIDFLETLIHFILRDKENIPYFDDLLKAKELLIEASRSIEDYECLDDEDKEFVGLAGFSDFDEQWYKVNEVIEWGMELYAQYLVKRLEARHIEPSNRQS